MVFEQDSVQIQYLHLLDSVISGIQIVCLQLHFFYPFSFLIFTELLFSSISFAHLIDSDSPVIGVNTAILTHNGHRDCSDRIFLTSIT